MVRAKPIIPAGHGELLVYPDAESWAELARANHEAARNWAFAVAGRPAFAVRELARGEALARAAAFSVRLGIDDAAAPGDPNALIVATGHQPELYHPGVWIKDFLLERLAQETRASAFDLVVDSDGFDTVAISSPCLTPDVHRCTQYLAVETKESCYACAGVPSRREVDDWIAAVVYQLQTLPAPSVRTHFKRYAAALISALPDASNLAELLTFARRRFEAEAHTSYLELPATSLCGSEAFAAFAVDLALAGERFVSAYNGALREYRRVNKTRTPAQPFPDLAFEESRFELPLWLVEAHQRTTVWCERRGEGVMLAREDGSELANLSGEPEQAIRSLMAAGLTLAPKALALTLFVRAFACDFFIHGVGGGGYDRVTDDVFRAYYGVEPPAFAVASLTMYLPLGMHVVTEEERAKARERFNRLEHNPDALLSEVEFDSAAEREQAFALAAEKTQLVSAIAEAGADKKALGLRIREVNARLGELLAPVKRTMGEQVALLESEREASEVLTDRTYPFCFWSPLEIADRAR